MKKKSLLAFTLVELIVVIAALALLSSIFIVYLNNFLEKGRDTKRLSDVNQISNAVKMFYRDEGFYPLSLTPGEPLVGSTSDTIYLTSVPSNPQPRIDGDCPDTDYSYSLASNFTGRDGYNINFCLGNKNSTISQGESCLTENGFSSDPDVCSEGSLIGKLVLWLDANDNSTLFTDSSCTTPAGDTNTIGCWKDKSVYENHAIQTNPSNEPTLNYDRLNALPVLSFDGSGDQILSNHQMDIGTVCLVANYNLAGFSNYPGLFTRSVPVDGLYDYIFTGNGAGSTFYPPYAVEDNYTNRTMTWDFAPLNDHKIICSRMKTVSSWADVLLGCDRGYSGRYWNGDIAEVMVFDEILNTKDREAVENYLSAKYNITLN